MTRTKISVPKTELLATTDEVITDVDVNRIKPTFRMKDGREVLIERLDDDQLAEAIYFTSTFLELQEKKTKKMEQVRKFLMMESSSRVHTEVSQYRGQTPIQFRHANYMD